MALDKYKAKRDFTQSPEPAGDAPHRSPGGRTPRFFCVQKHLASHLHYDFRLEHEGVLLSWAVPKGPSLDPGTKRLAMQVEDHPFDYGEFEGVIPSGYGAGIVMLWDIGTWTPEVDDVDAALKKGDLKFTLNGFKLKGSWVLVRTKGKWAGGGDRSWLLIKHRDEWAGDVDIAEFAPLSVKSEGDFADILANGNPDIWHSHRPAQGGETGAMFEKIIARALEMRSTTSTNTAKGTKEAKGTTQRKDTKESEGRATESAKAAAPARKAVARKAAGSRAAKKPATRKATKRKTSPRP
jgi:DNA ligase D-like protein (predicted 3'-phosphoesterase)